MRMARPISGEHHEHVIGPYDLSVYEILADVGQQGAFLTSLSRPPSNVISIMSNFSV